MPPGLSDLCVGMGLLIDAGSMPRRKMKPDYGSGPTEKHFHGKGTATTATLRLNCPKMDFPLFRP